LEGKRQDDRSGGPAAKGSPQRKFQSEQKRKALAGPAGEEGGGLWRANARHGRKRSLINAAGRERRGGMLATPLKRKKEEKKSPSSPGRSAARGEKLA